MVGRGGFLPRPEGKLASGTYLVASPGEGGFRVEEEILTGVLDFLGKVHPSNLGIPVAAALAEKLGVPAYTVDPVVVDEFSPEAEISGYAPIVRRSTAHILSVKAAARRAAREIGRPLADCNLVVGHLGGGITIAAIRKGKIVDNNIALLGGGPFTPQRAGELPADDLIELCFSGKFSKEDLKEELTRRGGLVSYLGTNRMQDLAARIAAGDETAALVVGAMVYAIAKSVGAMSVAAGGDLEAIVFTGGLARADLIRTSLRRRLGHLAPVLIFPEALEMSAMAEGALAVLSGAEAPLRYRLPGPVKTGAEPESLKGER